MNNLQTLLNLKNRYFTLRHGESQANVQGIILSDPLNGVPDFGLTEKGQQQVKISVSTNKYLDEKVIIYSSDFLRAKETAEIAKDILNTDKIHFTELLRERFFGNFEKTSNENYEKVWMHDKENVHHEIENVESITSVLNRTTRLILDLEKKFQNKKILLVSHGDSLQILQTGFLKTCSSRHRDVPNLNTAEIRELLIK
jgi:broad specificity phosphatase PhoE